MELNRRKQRKRRNVEAKTLPYLISTTASARWPRRGERKLFLRAFDPLPKPLEASGPSVTLATGLKPSVNENFMRRMSESSLNDDRFQTGSTGAAA
jgi:hypothetical protein